MSTVPCKIPLLLFEPLLLLSFAVGTLPARSGTVQLLGLSWQYQVLCSCTSHCREVLHGTVLVHAVVCCAAPC